jgi:hypothetical protein
MTTAHARRFWGAPMARSERDVLRALAEKWEREIYSIEREAEAKHRDWTNVERRLMAMQARGMRACVKELKEELSKVRRD